MSENIFVGFDHGEHREEVTRRWGADAAERSDAWWNGLSAEKRERRMAQVTELNRDWATAAQRSIDPASQEAQTLARRHVEWLRGIPGTPANDRGGGISPVMSPASAKCTSPTSALPRTTAEFWGRPSCETR